MIAHLRNPSVGWVERSEAQRPPCHKATPVGWAERSEAQRHPRYPLGFLASAQPTFGDADALEPERTIRKFRIVQTESVFELGFLPLAQPTQCFNATPVGWAERSEAQRQAPGRLS